MRLLLAIDELIRREAEAFVIARENRDFARAFLPTRATWKVCGVILAVVVVVGVVLFLAGLTIEEAEFLSAVLVASAFAWRLNFHRRAYLKKRAIAQKAAING